MAKKKNDKNITVIITLYKTPKEKLLNLIQYKNFKNIWFNQESNKSYKKKIKKIVGFEFKYYSDKKNIGLSKSSNFLLNKVSTKYCLFTQADITINEKSIKRLAKILSRNNDAVIIAPNLKNKLKNKSQQYRYVKQLDLACILCDVKKLRKIGFFDEDFFLYWEDIFLVDKINKSNYKMIIANNVNAIHSGGKSTQNSLKIQFIRIVNFKYGELLYDYKSQKLRQVKILRQLLQSMIFLFANVFMFKKIQSLQNLAIMLGILKFIKFYFMKKVFSLINL